MKISELLYEGKGSWKIQNLSGEMKTFKSSESPDARAWMKTRGTGKFKWNGTEWIPAPPPAAKIDRDLARAEREDEKRRKGGDLDLQKVYNKVMQFVGDSFPDGDPIDMISPWIQRQGVESYYVVDVINKAMKRYGSGVERKGLYAYLADMWKSTAADAVYDAKNGHVDTQSPYYDVEEDGKITPRPNPWA